MLRQLAIVGARFTPRFIKNWVHSSRKSDLVARKLFGGLLGSGVATIPSGPMKGLKLVCGPQVSHAHLRGVYEQETLEAVDRLVQPGSVCYDLGASIGYLSLLMARKARQVFAFEPAPHAIAEIHKHAEANGIDNITVIPSPVSNNEREVSFALTDAACGSAINEVETRWPILKLRTTTLDRFTQNHPPPDFIKIDVEGEEGRVLEGGQDMLRKYHPLICCELHSVEAARQVHRVLQNCGYALYTLDKRPFEIPAEIVAGDLQVLCLPLRG